MSLLIAYSNLEVQYKTFLNRSCRSPITVNYRMLAAQRFTNYLLNERIQSFKDLSQQHGFGWIDFLKERKLKEQSLYYNARCIRHFVKFLATNNMVVPERFPEKLVFYRKPKLGKMIDPPNDDTVKMLLDILKGNLNTYLNWKSYLILRLLLLTRFTIADILQIRDSDIDFNKMTIVLGGSSKQSECPMNLLTDIKKFIYVRNRNTPANSNYLIRSVNGYFTDYTLVKTQIFKQWCLFSSAKLNATIVKRFRHRKLQQSVGVHEFRRLTGYNECYCYSQFY